MIDTLCANGISVLGVLNQETLDNPDYNNPDPTVAAAYRQEFADTAALLAGHFSGRIKYWEVWNEQDLDPDDSEGPYVDPDLYAPLLVDTHQAIKNANPAAQVLYGGLSSAWDRSHNYFESVYNELRVLGAVGLNSPFDYLAIHPYPDVYVVPPESPDLNPSIYLKAVGTLPHTTIVDKFMKTMADPLNGNGNKMAWATEVGWNSAAGSSNLPCWENMVVTQAEQAVYLKQSFDTLLNEVPLWEQPGTQAVEKVIWYQYRDVGVDATRICDELGAAATVQTVWENRVPLGYIPQIGSVVTQSTILDWWFGLYQGDKSTAKSAQCAFAAYPSTGLCQKQYLPIIFKNY